MDPLHVTATVQEVRSLGAAQSLYGIILDEIKTRLMRETAPKLFSHFTPSPEANVSSFDSFSRAIDELYSHYNVYLDVMAHAQPLLDEHHSPDDELNKWFRAALLSQLPLKFDRLVSAYFDYSFRVFSGTMAASEQDHEMDGDLAKDEFSCHICEADSSGCKCTAVLQRFQETNRKLLEMGIMKRLCGPTIGQLVEEKIESLTAEMCQGMLRSNSRLLENWLEKVVLEWLRRIYQYDGDAKVDKAALRATFSNFKHRLEYFLCETYARIIIDQFFNIIIGEYKHPRSN